MIQVTVVNETTLIERFRASLQYEARRLVQDHPDRAGKQFAGVTFPMLDFVHAYQKMSPESIKYEWV